MRIAKKAERLAELRAILAAYRHLTVEEAENGNWGDIQVEVEAEVWRLEQDLHSENTPVAVAAFVLQSRVSRDQATAFQVPATRAS
jgi:hypothetical protein